MARRLLPLALLAIAGCSAPLHVSTVLPAGQGDLYVAALVELDDEARFPVQANTGLAALGPAAPDLRAEVRRSTRLHLIVFLYDSAALAAAIAPGLPPSELGARVTVAPAIGGAVLPEAGRSDWVSADFAPRDDLAV